MAARGLYINTIDPDDWVAPDYYELLWMKAVETSADIVKGTRIRISEENDSEIEPRSDLNAVITAGTARGEPLYLRMHFEHQTIIFKRAILNEKIRYGTSGNSADTTFLLRLCSVASSFVTENRAYYYYLQRASSATGEFSLKRSRNELCSLAEQIDHFIREGNFDRYVYNYCADRYFAYVSRFLHAWERGVISAQEKKQYISDLKAQFMRIPDYEILYVLDPKILALIELDMIPMKNLSQDLSARQDEVSEWMDYIMALDGAERDQACKEMEDILVSYIGKRIRGKVSIWVISRELRQMGSKIRRTRQRINYYILVMDTFVRNSSGHKKTLRKMLFRPRK